MLESKIKITKNRDTQDIWANLVGLKDQKKEGKVGTRSNPKGLDLEIETLYFEWTRGSDFKRNEHCIRIETQHRRES